MTRIYLFIPELATGILLVKLSPETTGELINIALIVAVRIAFYFFEKKFPKIPQIFKRKKTE